MGGCVEVSTNTSFASSESCFNCAEVMFIPSAIASGVTKDIPSTKCNIGVLSSGTVYSANSLSVPSQKYSARRLLYSMTVSLFFVFMFTVFSAPSENSNVIGVSIYPSSVFIASPATTSMTPLAPLGNPNSNSAAPSSPTFFTKAGSP